jgi:NAD-dependent dihydropyrimidine dehydrogenase PreA subunit
MGIYVDNEKCVGCNKCIRICPVKFANKVGDNNLMEVNNQFCIKCGMCIKTCEHGARYYSDDTELMLKDLEKGLSIAAVIAPSARANFNINKLIAALKSIGIRACYDVSLGADITTWAYIKYIKEKRPSSIITQPCPVIVNYIEKYESDLIRYLIPVHSPMMCLAVYLKKYLGIKDKIAFISPCIGKEDEISKYSDYIAYNVTFSKLYEAIKDKYDNSGQVGNSVFDLPEAYLGRLFSRPGGLKENVLAYLEDVKVKQVEGPHVYEYLSGDYKNANDTVKPTIVDVLNCENGCNQGTACNNARPVDDIDYQFDNMKKEITNKRRQKKLINEFDKKLNLNDFIITYTPTKIEIKYPTKNEVDALFNSMFKYTKEERTLNCGACGYHSCYDMIVAIYNGLNKKENCVHYIKTLISKEYKELDEKNNEIKTLFEETNSTKSKLEGLLDRIRTATNNLNLSMKEVASGYSESTNEIEKISGLAYNLSKQAEVLDKLSISLSEKASIINNVYKTLMNISESIALYSLNASIEAARIKDSQGFSVIANEIRKLSDKTKQEIKNTKDEVELLMSDINNLPTVSKIVKDMVENVNKSLTNTSALIEELTAKGEEISGEINNLASNL